MENYRNNQITFDKGILRYSSLDNFERPKYQIKDCVKMVDCILSENDQLKECFLLHSTLPYEPDFRDDIRIINGNDDTIFENQTAIAHCISADAKMNEGFAETISNHISGLQEYCYKSKAFVGSVIPFWDNDSNRFIYNLVPKTNSLNNVYWIVSSSLETPVRLSLVPSHKNACRCKVPDSPFSLCMVYLVPA